MVSSDRAADRSVQFGPSTRAVMHYPRSLWALCHHEAAHAVAGVLHGGEVASVRIVPGRVRDGLLGGPRGETSFASLAVSRHPETAYAGAYGEARALAQRRPGLREVRRALDSTGCHDKQVLTAAGGESAGESIVPLLERCWPSIAGLAELLHRNGKASYSDVLRVLSLSEDPGARAIEVSMIRSGAAPGTFTVKRPAN